MKRRTILRLLLFQPILILFFTGCALFESEGRIKVLFIGNSYTSSNGLPIMFERMASSGGHRANTAMIAPGGWTLADHAQSTDTIRKIRSDEWDYVVLQEQSVIPSLAGFRERQMYPAIRQLQKEIAAIGAETVLFMTWGRRDGLPSEGHQDFAHMQASIEIGYFNIGHELDLLIAPVGVAWWKSMRSAPKLNLWVEDGSHPNREGSYLAACVLYSVIFGESPEGIDFTAEIADDWGLYFQTVAAQTIAANRAGWNLP